MALSLSKTKNISAPSSANPLTFRQPAMQPGDPLVHVAKIILREGWKLFSDQREVELEKCAAILLKRIRAGDAYPSLLSYISQLGSALAVRSSQNADGEMVERIMALVRNVRTE
jgi:hypothetical protein